ncbi:alcohol dehydrogenase catalytic domain-containing protein [Paenibacillus sp. HWE-109]|uniref:alcohol dehydrogenase catalytic domain-containing protein n=1 Tax=Paenibacillus sp. HWE-109 TaxID=1306526 RepID=UPI001EDEBEFF|nr:alcohol dehydrogenase catalytic domain-containing protein [Paenibacillus sp. HWE-109]UKS27954.1 alcohol dehydrogenase catalytic domain-containing protein [Paenibacillus sp. HWE-109]
MKGYAVVFKERWKVSFEEVQIPEPGDDDVVIDVEYSWISNGTESSFLRGERLGGDTPYQEGEAEPFPIVAGYQKTGVVTQIGAKVAGVRVGDRVFATISRVEDMFDPYGGHVSPAVTKANQVWLLPEGEQAEAYAGLVLAQVGYNCGMRPPVVPGDIAVVIGDGLVGNWTAQTLMHRGAQVIVLGRHQDRLKHMPPGCHCLQVQSAESANGQIPPYVAIVVDTVGDMNTFLQLLPLMKPNGHMVSAGFYGRSGHIDIQLLRHREITLHAPAGWTTPRMRETLDAIHQGWFQTRELITHRFPADRASDAWNLILGKKEPFLGIVLDWKKREGDGFETIRQI